MTATVAGIHLGLDTHANRPAANTVPDGSIYSCSTHSLVYKSNFAGNSWATWATLGISSETLPATIIDAKGDLIAGTAADTAARLAVGTNNQVLTADSSQSTGVKWATPSSGSTVTGNSLFAVPPGFNLVATGTSALVASTGYMGPIIVPAPMLVRNFVAQVSGAGSGTHQWGLFDFSASATAATKLAGGTGALNATGEVSIAASGAPVSINAGFYVLIVLAPAANVATVRIVTSTVATKMNQQSQASYAWDDTPDLTSGWGGAGSTTRLWYLTGDVVSGTQF